MKKIKSLVYAQLVQGASAHGLALSIACGAVCGVFPLFGFTTLLAAGVGGWLKLNHPTLQATNYLMAPFQLLMIPVFLLVGERICGAPPISLNPATIVKEFWTDIPLFFSHYGMAGVHGVLAWAIFALPLGAAIYFPARAMLSRLPAAVKIPLDLPEEKL